jgi:hypothetical protein
MILGIVRFHRPAIHRHVNLWSREIIDRPCRFAIHVNPLPQAHLTFSKNLISLPKFKGGQIHHLTSPPAF